MKLELFKGRSIFLLISVALIVIYAFILSDESPDSVSIFSDILFIVSLLLIIPFLRKRNFVTEQKAINKIKTLFGFVVLGYGIFYLVGPRIDNISFIAFPVSYIIGIISIIIYLIIYQLFLFKRRKRSKLFFKILCFFIFLTVIASSIGRDYFSTDDHIIFKETGLFFWITIGFMVLISFKTSWVNYLNKKEKFIALFICIVISNISTFSKFSVDYSEYSLLQISSFSSFVNLTGIFIGIHATFSVLSLLLHLPTAGIIDKKVKQISSLHNLSSAVSEILDLNKLADLITELSLDVVESNSACLVIMKENGNEYTIVSEKHRTNQNSEIFHPALLNILNSRILQEKELIVINELNQESDIAPDKKALMRGSLVGVPLYSSKKGLLGILYVTKEIEHGFDENDSEMLRALSNQAVTSMENARLLKESIEKERLEQELKVAREVQLKLLPKAIPKIKGMEIDAFSLTANEVGGDYYDFVNITNDSLGVFIGDVSGKGISAAFYMAEMKGIIQSLTKNYNSPQELMVKINESLYGNIDRKIFISLIYSIINLKENTIVFARAGHNPLLHYSCQKDECLYYQTTGIGLGLDGGNIFNKQIKEKTIKIAPGDILIYYTDGITETFNRNGEEFGEENLLKTLYESRNLHAGEIKEELITRVNNFMEGMNRFDDMTFVILKFLEI